MVELKSSDDLKSVPEYTSFPKSFENYKWYKPLLVIIVTAIIFAIFNILIYGLTMKALPGGVASFLTFARGGYDALNAYSLLGLVAILSVGLMVPSLYIATKIVKDRPFSSYSSSRGGWNWKIFAKIFVLTLVIYVIIGLVTESFKGIHFNNHFTILTFIIALIVIPLQCIAEEYFMRGLVMQTVGSWIARPVLAIIVQSLVFTSLHPYNILGIITVFVMGLLLGFITYYTKGIEASSGIHVANNLTSFMFTGFGISSISTNVSVMSFAIDMVSVLIAVGIVYYVINKYGWFKSENL